MAFTTSSILKTVFGNKRYHVIRCTADAATQAIVTGMETVDNAWIQAETMVTTAANVNINELAAGTSTAGYVSVTGVTSGDIFFLNVIGH